MATKLSVGSREVQTTPSSLMSRMGVVKGQTGDGFQIAADALGQSLSLIGLQKAKVAEEKWKSQFNVDAYKTLTKYAADNPLDLANYVNLSEGYLKEALTNVPKRFEGWAEGQIAMQIAEHSARISAEVTHKENTDAITLMDERTNTLRGKLTEELFAKPVDEFPEYYENTIFRSLSDLSASRENLRSGLTANYLTGDMAKSKEKFEYDFLVDVEMAKWLSADNQLMQTFVEAEKDGMRSYKGTQDQYNVAGAMEKGQTMMKQIVSQYEDRKSVGEIDSTTLTDILPEDLQEIATTRRNNIETFFDDWGQATLGALEEEKASWNMEINRLQNGTQGSINNVNQPIPIDQQYEIISDITKDIEVSDEQWKDLSESATLAHMTNKWGKEVLASTQFKETGPRPIDKEAYTKEGKTFSEATQKIMDNANVAFGFEDNANNRQFIENNLQKFLVQEYTRRYNDGKIIYLENFNFTRVENPEGGYYTNPSVEAAKHLAWKHKKILPQFNSFLQGVRDINLKDPESMLKLEQIAGVYSYVMTRDGQQPVIFPENIDRNLHIALMDYHEDRINSPLLTQDGYSLITEKFLSRINPTTEELDNKLAAVQEQWNVYDGRKWTVDRGNEDWFRSALKSWMIMNPEIKDRIMTKYLGVFEFRHDVPAFLPDIPFTDPSHLKEGREKYDAQWNEGTLELFIDELINGGIEEDMQYLLANSFDNVTQIKTSNSEVYRTKGWVSGDGHAFPLIDLTPRRKGATSAFLRAGAPKGTEFDFKLTNVFKLSMGHLDKYLKD